MICCKRLDRVKIPFVGGLLQSLGFKGKLPKIHRAKVHYGDNVQAMAVETWTYIAKRFYKCYNTKQVFTSDYPHGAHSVLSPWHIKGRYAVDSRPFIERFIHWLNDYRPIPLKPKHPLIQRIMRLPDPKQRLDFMRRFEQTGAFNRYV